MIAGCLGFLMGHGQEITVRGQFLAHEVKLGEPIAFTLSVRHPESATVLFPDSTYAFTPFEFTRKYAAPTSTRQGISYDSATYVLTTFEIDSLQSLRLPVYVIHQGDSSAVYSSSDTVQFVRMVFDVPDSVSAAQLPLRTNTQWWKVEQAFNYPVALLVLGITVVVLVLVYVIFGKKIRLWLKRRKLMRQFEAYRNSFTSELNTLRDSFSPEKAEQLLVQWKKYMEALEGQPYTKYTSLEISRAAPDPSLAQALRNIDRAIYGRVTTEVYDSFHELRSQSEDRLHRQLTQLNQKG